MLRFTRSSSPFAHAVRLAGLLAALSLVTIASAWAQTSSAPSSADPAARRLYEAARQRMRTDAGGAAEELQLLVQQFPRDVLAPKALVDLAELRKALGDDAGSAAAIDRLLSDYPRTLEAAGGFVLQSELKVETASTLADLEEARTGFQRVVLLFGRDAYPRLDARALARVRSAELGQQLGDLDGAASELVQAVEDEPPSRITGRARLVLGKAWLLQGRWQAALEVLQSLADDVPKDSEGVPMPDADGATSTAGDRAAARHLLTLGHRHHLRPEAGQRRWLTVEQMGGELNLKQPVGVAADADGRVVVVDRATERVSIFRPESRTWEGRSLKDPVRPTFIRDTVAVVTEESVSLPFNGQRAAFLEPVSGKEKSLDKLRAATRGRQGVWFVAAKGWDGVLVYPTPRRGSLILGGTRPEIVDLDRDELGRILALDADASRVVRIGLDRRTSEVLASGDWKKPTAVARDDLGHVYVLDGGPGQIFVYDAGGRRIASLGPSLGNGIELKSPEDLAVDGAGRIYVADRKLPYLVVLD